MKCSILGLAAALVAALASTTSQAQTIPTVAQAISLRLAINNDAQVNQRIPNNEPQINTLLPIMLGCRPNFDSANAHLTSQVAYVAQYNAEKANGTLTPAEQTRLNGLITGQAQQVYNFTNLGYQCVYDWNNSGRAPATGDVFASNGVQYHVVGGPSGVFANGIVSDANQLPLALRNKIQAAAATGASGGWTFYIMHSPDDFKDSALYPLTGTTDAGRQTYFNGIRKLGAFTDPNLKAQVFFEYFYSTGTNTYVWSPNGTNEGASIAHEDEHLNDYRLGSPSQTDASFNTAYNQGVAAYNAATGHDPDIGANFISNGAATGKRELFAELGAYWDLQHMPGFTPVMASKAYSATEVLTYFSLAWTIFQAKKTAGTW